MSFFDDASLAFLPSGGAGKDGKAYSIKPTDGTGDFTFSRGSNLTATRVGPTGLIEKGRENLLLQSNQFDTTWSLSSVSVTSGQSGYDGSSDAWELEATATTSARIEVSNSNTGVLRASIYVKEGTTNWVHLNTGSQRRVWFNLSTGSVGTITNSANTFDAKIESVSGAAGWYRISYVVIDPTHFRIYPASTDGGDATLGDNIYIQDAQLEIGLAATEVISSGATTGKAGLLEDEPRFDYSGGATCPSLLLEPSRTNLVGYSELINPTIVSSVWKQLGSNTFTNNYGTSPDGKQNSTLIEFGGTNSSYQVYYQMNFSAGDYTTSIYAKGSGSFKLGIYDNASILTDTITLTSEWQRFEVTKTAAATSGGRGVWLYPNGDGDTIEVWGGQVEAGSYPTSYIPNHSGGSATRGEDGFSGAQDLTGIFTDSSQGTIYFEIEDLGHRSSGAGAVFRYGSATDNLQMAIYVDNNGVKFYFYNKGAFLISANTDVGSTYKFAIVFNGTSLTGFRNTTKYGPLTDDETFDVTRVTDMNFETNSVKLKQLLYFPEALSDADCITLTT